MAENKYYEIRSAHNKSITFSINLETDKRKKKQACIRDVKINGSFPRPIQAQMKQGISFINEVEKIELEKEPAFVELVEKDRKITVHEINFRDLPESLQKEYDIEAYKKLKEDKK